jgi:alpha-beta hydrolase superfamily lysophospholipase
VTAVPTPAPGRLFAPEPEVTVRGTVVLLPGRGEHAAVYQRFGRRLAFDGWAVHVLDDAAQIAEAAAGFAEAVRPLVLAGSDTGARQALAAVATGDAAWDGLILAGLPPAGPDGSLALDWEAELDARTACPVHRDRLTRDPVLVRGALSRAVPVEIGEVGGHVASLTVPVLVVHGDTDPLAPVAEAEKLAATCPDARLARVHGGRHDILNDVHHRTVAAAVVLWLEQRRAGGDPILQLT